MNPKTIYEKDSDHDGLTDAQELALRTIHILLTQMVMVKLI